MQRIISHRLISPRALAVCAGSLLAASPALGIVLSWNNTLGGSAGVSTNWSPNAVPTAADILNFNLVAAYPVTFPAGVPASLQMNFNQGTVTLSFASPHALSQQMVVGLTAGSNSTVDLGSGTLNTAGIVSIGGNATGTGVLRVRNTGRLESTAATGIRVGNTGNGTLNIENEGVVRVHSGPVLVGALAGSQGAVNISSTGPVGSQLQVNDQAVGDMTIGVAGPGTVTLGILGSMAVADDLIVGPTAGVAGTLTVGTGAFAQCADALIGANTTVAAAGTGTVNVGPGGSMTVSGAGTGVTTIGDPDGGTGTLNLTGGLFSTRVLNVHGINGLLNHTGGELRITAGGSFTPVSGPTNLNSASATDQAHLHYQGSTGTLNGGFRVGTTGFGSLTIDAGAVVNLPNGLGVPMIVGANATGEGTLAVTGTGSQLNTRLNPNGLAIGSSGKGTATIASGGFLNAGSLNVALNPGSEGDVNISGGGRVDALTVQIGGNGDASVNMSGSSQFNASNLTAFPGSTIAVDDSVFTCINTADLRGSTTISSSGEIAASTVLVSGAVSGGGNLYGNVTIQPGGSVSATSGDFDIGSPANGNSGFVNQGLLNVGSRTVRILDGDGSPGGDIAIAGGNLFANGLDLGANDSLTGFGGINAPIDFLSSVITATTPAGIVFNGPVFASSPCIWAGTKFTFAAGGDFIGSGGIPTQVASEEEASITAISSLILGDHDINAAINLFGPLHIGGSSVTLRSNTAAPLGVLTTINGGTLSGPADNTRTVIVGGFPFPPQEFTVTDSVPLVLGAGDVFRGTGTVLAQMRTEPGSVVEATGPLSLRASRIESLLGGVIPQGNTVVPWNGDLLVGSHSVSFETTHTFGAQSTVSLAGGSITGPFLRIDGLLTGHGVLAGSVGNGGVLRPGGEGIGEIRVTSTFRNATGVIFPIPGAIELDISGDQGFAHDEIVVEGGDAELGGTLTVTVLDAEPAPGQVYTVLRTTAGSVLGTFPTVNLPTLSFGGSLEVRYTSNEVQIVVRPECLADFNNDGNLDPDDLGDFINCFFASPPCESADFNNDGNTDPDDLGDFINLFFAGCP